jgi:alpha-amylase/alpha-mannosidase (GH57 family)
MSTSLLFGIHCHQPIDNFDWVLEEAIEKSYKPFFQILKEFPQFKCSIHYSGWLLEYIEKNDQELFSLMQSLSNQLEFFTGGYYEPVLSAIPSVDRVGQIKKLNSYIKKHFNQEPKGLWLTERVWDNAIIKDLKECGVQYVVVDDYHLLTSGVKTENLNGYFLTEEGGESIALFPINQVLRYAIPFYSLEKTENILESFSNTDGKNAAVIFDDGEKFGIWPKTYETVYEKNWLRDFFSQTLANEKITVETFEHFYSNNPPIALSYLPTVSYFEMGEWSMTSKDTLALEHLLKNNPEAHQFIRGGTWKNFLTKYQESNWIHKRYIELSKKQDTSEEYKDALYKAQCNDVLWHGVFGGIYLPNLRNNAYKYIIECEKLSSNKKENLDIDFDGYDEYKYNTSELLTIISLKNGGQIFELDILDKNFNLQNTLTRYDEAYHSKIEVNKEQPIITVEDELATIHDNKLTVSEDISLITDWYFKKSAIDHIVPSDTTAMDFFNSSFHELSDFTNQPFDLKKSKSKTLLLTRDGGVFVDKKYETTLEKKYQFVKNSINLDVSIDTQYDTPLHYIQEWNLHFANIENLTFNGISLTEQLQGQPYTLTTQSLEIYDSYLEKTLIFSFEKELEIIIFTLNSVSQSEQGVDLTNQGITFGFVYPFTQTAQNSLQLKIE